MKKIAVKDVVINTLRTKGSCTVRYPIRHTTPENLVEGETVKVYGRIAPDRTCVVTVVKKTTVTKALNPANNGIEVKFQTTIRGMA